MVKLIWLVIAVWVAEVHCFTSFVKSDHRSPIRKMRWLMQMSDESAAIEPNGKGKKRGKRGNKGTNEESPLVAPSNAIHINVSSSFTTTPKIPAHLFAESIPVTESLIDPMSAYLSDHTTEVSPVVDNFRAIDPQEKDFYNYADPNDYLLPDEVTEANKILRARKTIREYQLELNDDVPVQTCAPPQPVFKESFWALHYLDPAKYERRSSLWVEHLQWSRRTHFMQLLPKEAFKFENLKSSFEGAVPLSSQVLIKEEYTILSPDMLAPVAQLVKVEADSLEMAKGYLSTDPLFQKNCYKANEDWRIFTANLLSSDENDRENSFDGDFLSPYVVCAYMDGHILSDGASSSVTKSTKQALKSTDELDAAKLDDLSVLISKSRRYQEQRVRDRNQQQAGDSSQEEDPSMRKTAIRAETLHSADPELPFSSVLHRFDVEHVEDGHTRIVQFSVLNGRGDRVPESKGSSIPMGELMLFNAYSQQDAVRFVMRDPLFQSFELVREESVRGAVVSGKGRSKANVASSTSSAQNVVNMDTFTFVHRQNPHLKLLLAPLNVVDVNGFHHALPISLAQQAALDPLMAMEPTTIFAHLVNHTSIGIKASTQQHTQWKAQVENDWILSQFNKFSIDVSYPRVSNVETLGITALNLPSNTSNLPYNRFSVMATTDEVKLGGSPPTAEGQNITTTAQKKSGAALKKKSKWTQPLMGRKALSVFNKFGATGTRKTLNYLDSYVPLEPAQPYLSPGHAAQLTALIANSEEVQEQLKQQQMIQENDYDVDVSPEKAPSLKGKNAEDGQSSGTKKKRNGVGGTVGVRSSMTAAQADDFYFGAGDSGVGGEEASEIADS